MGAARLVLRACDCRPCADAALAPARKLRRPTVAALAKIIIPRRKIPHDPGPLEMVLGALRVTSGVLLTGVGSVLVLLAALAPVRIAGARPAQWITVGLARAFLAVFAVRLQAPPAPDIRGHRGLVFFNHLSYLDAIVLFARGPVRFLATEGVRGIPFVGWIARAVDTFFVDRSDRASRAASRERIRAALTARPAPPVTLAPEGQIGPGGGVLPFRRGAFEIAVETGLPILPLLLEYEPFDAAVWQQKEWLLVALWRLGARTGGVVARVTPLQQIQPGRASTDDEEDAEAARLAAHAEEAFVLAIRGGRREMSEPRESRESSESS